MALRETLKLWSDGAAAFNQNNFNKALDNFHQITNYSARISFNIGCIYLRLDDKQKALKAFQDAILKDEHLVAAYFQLGLLHLKHRRFTDASYDFELACQCMQGCDVINYGPLGLGHKMYSCEVIYNQACAEAKAGSWDKAERLLTEAGQRELRKKHKLAIYRATKCVWEREVFSPFEMPSNTIFLPSKALVQNLEKLDYLGKAKVLVISVDEDDNNRKNATSRSVSARPPPPNYPPLNPAVGSKKMPLLTVNVPPPARAMTPPSRPPPPVALPRKSAEAEFKGPVYFQTDGKSSANLLRPRVVRIEKGSTCSAPRNVVTLYSLSTNQPTMLSFQEGEILEVIKPVDTTWFEGSYEGKSGLVLWNCVRSLR